MIDLGISCMNNSLSRELTALQRKVTHFYIKTLVDSFGRIGLRAENGSHISVLYYFSSKVYRTPSHNALEFLAPLTSQLRGVYLCKGRSMRIESKTLPAYPADQ